MQITGGTVSFSRTVKPADYESKAATVELSFLIEEGEAHDGILEAVGKIAMEKCLMMVGLKAPAAGATTAPKAAGKTKADLEADAMKALGAAPASGKGPKKPPAAPKTGQAISTGEPRGEADDVMGDVASAASVEDDDALLFSAAEAPKEITDAELTGAIVAHNAKIKNPPAIRQLINKYVAHPGQAKDIAQDKRAEFLEKLKAL